MLAILTPWSTLVLHGNAAIRQRGQVRPARDTAPHAGLCPLGTAASLQCKSWQLDDLFTLATDGTTLLSIWAALELLGVTCALGSMHNNAPHHAGHSRAQKCAPARLQLGPVHL